MARRRWLVCLGVSLFALGIVGCGDDPNPETHEGWDVGDCVTVGQGDIDEADCGDEGASKIVKIIGPLDTTGASCPPGTQSVKEHQVGPGIIQELKVCLED